VSQDLAPHINGFYHVLLIMGTCFFLKKSSICNAGLGGSPHGGLLLRADLIPIFSSLGMLTLARPAASFAALDHGANVSIEGNPTLLIDEMRGHFFTFSRGIAITLLIM